MTGNALAHETTATPLATMHDDARSLRARVRLLLLALISGAILLGLAPVAGRSDAVEAVAWAEAIGAGGEHTCMVRAGGAWCQGDNVSGDLGNGNAVDPFGSPTGDSYMPVPVTGLSSGVTAITTAGHHGCAIQSGGAWCWGWNGYGQLGTGSVVSTVVPFAVSGLASGVVGIAAGSTHSCAVTDGGAVWCWGRNAYGQLGDGSFAPSSIPVAVSGLPGAVTAVAAGEDHTCALTGAGGVWCWGNGASGRLGNGSVATSEVPVPVTGVASGATAVSAGLAHTCAIQGGAAKCWGYNINGQLGDFSVVASSLPVSVSGMTTGVTSITAGDLSSCAVKSGAASCWGSNSYGQLGNNNSLMAYSPIPVAVDGLASGVVTVSSGAWHGCARTATDDVKCWGRNEKGQVGNRATESCVSNYPCSRGPVALAVSGLSSGVVALSTGHEHSCLATAEGGAWCWGRNNTGALGNSSTVSNNIPQAVRGLSSGVTAVSAGQLHSCAIQNGGAWCWGYGVSGQLGNNGTTTSTGPVAVTGMETGVTAISAGADHTCAVQNAGAWCWGFNGVGRLGDGGSANSPIPAPVSGLESGVVAISAGGDQTCALTDSGGVWCWGENAYGALGTGNNTDSNVPVPVSGLGSGVTAISAGASHTCAVQVGAALCWGSNAFGQLGNNSAGQNSSLPVTPSGLVSGVSAIDAGLANGVPTCAIRSGASWCWGANGYGQIGNNSVLSSAVPVLVSGTGNGLGSNTSVIGAGVYHSCAVTTASVLWCWGRNVYGQLGNNTAVNSLVPVGVLGLGVDTDRDSIADATDNCDFAANVAQTNTDAAPIVTAGLPNDVTVANDDALGDACDADDDNDAILDTNEAAGCNGSTPLSSILADTDGDRIRDGAECALGSNPADAASRPPGISPGESDNDGLSNALETSIGSNPNNPDSDGDGINDGVEFRGYTTSPANTNTDGDGCPDDTEVTSMNSDRVVNSADLLLIAANFNSATKAQLDANKDRIVNAIDLLLVASNFIATPC